MLTNWIVKQFLQRIGLIENVLWSKYWPLVLLNQEKERKKKILHDVYWYKDIYKVLPPEIDKESLDKFLKTMFSYYDNRNDENLILDKK